MKGKQIKPAETVPIDASQVAAIEIERIVPSSFETQTRRRARFKAEEIASLGESFRKHGVRQPILVRPVYPNFEIVFGERRFLAAKSINLPKINCFIDDLTDEEVLELQYEENHRRQENSPLDDAFLFNFLMEKYRYSEEQLADRLGTTRENVLNKLTLNNLIPEAVTELESKLLYLKHAYYLARFPKATQKEIVNLQLAYKGNDREQKAVAFDEFKTKVETMIVRRLSSAPFDTLDPQLHIKKLTCDACPERTGFETRLFPDLADDDSCLNPKCFRLKTDTHLKLQREAIAMRMPNVENKSLAEVVKTVPLVTEKSYAPEHTPFGKAVIKTNVPSLAKPECEYSELSLDVHLGEHVYSCQNEACEIHHPKPKPVTGDSLSEDERERLWFDYNRHVLAVVREQILVAAVESFDDYSTFWMFDDLIQKLIVEFWWSLPIETKQTVSRLLRSQKGVPDARSPYWEYTRFVKLLNKAQQSQILFLLVSAGESAHRFETDIVEEWLENLAMNYTKLNYHRLDAEARYELAPEEFKAKANLYLQYIRNGHYGAEVPVFWVEPAEDGEAEDE